MEVRGRALGWYRIREARELGYSHDSSRQRNGQCPRKIRMGRLCSCCHFALQESGTFAGPFSQLCSSPSRFQDTIVKLKRHHPKAFLSHPLNKKNFSKPYPWSTEDKMMKTQTVRLYCPVSNPGERGSVPSSLRPGFPSRNMEVALLGCCGKHQEDPEQSPLQAC